MSPALQRHATPWITGLFLVSLISGIALFFHFGTNWFREMHEWLSMVLILPFVLHLWKNWRPMTAYFTRPPFAVATIASLGVALVFGVLSGQGGAGGPPQFAFTHAIMSNSPVKVAPLLGSTPEKMIEQLIASGFASATIEMTLSEIAATSGKNEMQLVAAVLPKKP